MGVGADGAGAAAVCILSVSSCCCRKVLCCRTCMGQGGVLVLVSEEAAQGQMHCARLCRQCWPQRQGRQGASCRVELLHALLCAPSCTHASCYKQ